MKRMLLAVGALVVLGVSPAGAIVVPLDVEFDAGLRGPFGSVDVVEDGDGGLRFEVSVGGDLGPDADLHEFYFNLTNGAGDLRIETLDAASTPYALRSGRPTRGGAGSRFEHVVSFGNGAGARGNGTLGSARFVIRSASGPLTLSHLLERSTTSAGIAAHFAAHVQGTSLTRASDSETIGALVPEPGPSLLLLVGLAGVGLGRGWRRRRSPR